MKAARWMVRWALWTYALLALACLWFGVEGEMATNLAGAILAGFVMACLP